MQFTLHATRRTPHGASCLVLAIPAWLVKTRRAPSRHSRNARVYAHTTTAMHKLSTPPPLVVGGFSHIGSRNTGAPSRKGCVVNGQMPKAQVTTEYAAFPSSHRKDICVCFFQCNVWKKRTGRPNVGGVSTRGRNGAPSRKGCVVNGQMTKASTK